LPLTLLSSTLLFIIDDDGELLLLLDREIDGAGELPNRPERRALLPLVLDFVGILLDDDDDRGDVCSGGVGGRSLCDSPLPPPLPDFFLRDGIFAAIFFFVDSVDGGDGGGFIGVII